jgi:radical SAM superfamily enzyme YgiQ (UPF0313 family)
MAQKKDIVLVYPPITLEERYNRILAEGGSSAPPLGICWLAANIRKEGFGVDIIDAEAEGLSLLETVNRIIKMNPKCVGISANTIVIFRAQKVASLIKQKMPSIVTIIGGPHITAAPVETMKRMNEFDIGVVGEGEITIVELLKKLKMKSSVLDKVPGLLLRRNGQIINTGIRALIENLDSLPLPAWDLLPDLAKYYRPPPISFNRLPSSSLVTSRGCFGKCKFCDRSVFGNKLRAHSAEYVVKMVKELYYKYGIKDILFDDDGFLIFKKRTREICKLMQSENWSLTWSCNSRVDIVNPEILKMIKEAGCWQIAFGIESGSQKVLDIIGKGITLQQIKIALKWTKEADIRTKGFFMNGNPKDTIVSINETIQFIKKVDLDDFQMTIFTPLPGCEFYKSISKYGSFENDWKKMNLWNVVFIPDGLTEKQLINYQNRAFKEFYLRPKIIFSYLKMCKSPIYILKFIKGIKIFIKMMFKVV